MPNLFTPLQIKDIMLKNRIGISPMCQYASVDGFATDWHLVHLGARAIGGAALIILEASAVEARGRISPDDLGIYKDEHITKLSTIASFIESFGSVPGIQIGHSGRKGSTKNPWKEGNRHVKENVALEDGGFEIVGPFPVPFYPDGRVPHELSKAEISEIQDKFAAAAERALKAGFKWLEVHGAHGYLLNSFYSPLSNFRTDEYGGSFENRIRMILETVTKVRAVWPQNLPLAVRLSASDWVEGGWTVDDSVELSKRLKALGVDLVDCSSGSVRPGDRYEMKPGWQVPLADAVRSGAQIATAAVGMIQDPAQANDIIQKGQADIILIARESMRDPQWPYHAARALKDAGALGADFEPKTVLPPNYSYAL